MISLYKLLLITLIFTAPIFIYMPEKIEISELFPVSQEKLYLDWLNSEDHSAFTGGEAVIDPLIGGEFTTWDGYISGRNIDLVPFTKITQSWRTTDFPPHAPDSVLEIHFHAEGDQTRISLVHFNIPEGQGAMYKQGWVDYYFIPMHDFFS